MLQTQVLSYQFKLFLSKHFSLVKNLYQIWKYEFKLTLKCLKVYLYNMSSQWCYFSLESVWTLKEHLILTKDLSRIQSKYSEVLEFSGLFKISCRYLFKKPNLTFSDYAYFIWYFPFFIDDFIHIDIWLFNIIMAQFKYSSESIVLMHIWNWFFVEK